MSAKTVLKAVYWAFMIESLLFIILGSCHVARFAPDIGNTFMLIGIFIGMGIVSILVFTLRKNDNKSTRLIATFYSILIVLLGVYYPTQLI